LRALLPIALVLAACQPPVSVRGPSASVMPDLAANSTLKVQVDATYRLADESTRVFSWSGTAWIVDAKGTELVTAGHVCAASQPEAALVSAHYRLTDRKGIEYAATLVKRSDTPDLCILRTIPDIGSEMDISPRDPHYAEELAYVGAPLGIWGDGQVPIYFGHYAGGGMITTPATGGASGSAVWGSSGVVGVLVSGMPRFQNAVFMVSRAELVAFLAD
jgi:hypothetical protein